MSVTSIREAIENVSAAISTDPSKARSKNAPATARLTAGLQCEVSGPHNERLVTDMPPAMGGAASGPNPGWLLRGALASCTATVIAMRAAKLGMVLSSLEVTVESDSDNRGILGLDEDVSAGLASVRMKVKIGAPEASPATLREIVAWADAHSPVGCTMRQAPGCSLDVEVVSVEDSN
ncbi:MAG TPA: OsmC family protein [Burkholderiales bacterium]